MSKKNRLFVFLAVVALAAVGSMALAQGASPDAPISDWMTKPVTPIAHRVQGYTKYIAALVLPYLVVPQVLLLYCIIKFREGGGRKPATFHENLPLEIFWTVVPALTLVIIAAPSYRLIKDIENPPPADERIIIRGHQFFWSYEYPEYGISISDTALVVPSHRNVVADLTSVDVIHSWWVPAFGVKMDAVPGRLTQLWFNIEEEGWYKGQCAELCGALHSQMYIDVHSVTPDEFKAWVAKKVAENEAPAETPDAAATDKK